MSVWAFTLAIQEKNVYVGIFGSFLLFQFIANIGICSAVGCELPAEPDAATSESIILK